MDLLLHVCCGPCATVAVPDWREAGHQPRALFFNPNIEPQAERDRRLAALRTLAADIDLPVDVVDGEDAGEETLAALAAWQDGWRAGGPADREGRCRLCIVLRLFETARRAADIGVPAFATSLAVSRYQSHSLIEEAGTMAAAAFGVDFRYRDQRPLFRRQFDECRRLGLYRQSYCGCALSKWEAWHDRMARRSASG
jgi:predicted adenine nucleotide alpha hydrolase (AANH) superfamily ATPase